MTQVELHPRQVQVVLWSLWVPVPICVFVPVRRSLRPACRVCASVGQLLGHVVNIGSVFDWISEPRFLPRVCDSSHSELSRRQHPEPTDRGSVVDAATVIVQTRLRRPTIWDVMVVDLGHRQVVARHVKRSNTLRGKERSVSKAIQGRAWCAKLTGSRPAVMSSTYLSVRIQTMWSPCLTPPPSNSTMS